MLEALFESPVKEKLLLFLLANEGSYPSEIARNFAFNLNAVQFQLKKLENAGVLYSQLRGKVRLYGLNPGYRFRKELHALLQKTLDFLSATEKDKYYVLRLRPWQAGEPHERPISGVGTDADGYSRQPGRPGTGEKAVKKERRTKQIQYLPKKIETLDFSTD
jgi:DNA-binding transcriptional ArsR family regulator